MKKYHLSYEFLGDKRSLSFDNLFEFYQKFDEIFDNAGVNQQSISFHTEEVKPPVTAQEAYNKYMERKGEV